MFGYFFSCSFMYLIHAFWLVALAAADRIAISPVELICLASRSTSDVPICLVSAWLMTPEPPEPPDALAAAPPDDDPPEFAAPVLVLLFLDVELQAARTPPASTTDSAAVATRRAVRFPVIVLPFPRWSVVELWCAW